MSDAYWMRDSAYNPELDTDLIEVTTLSELDNAMTDESPRGHLGMSQIGKKDQRSLWFKFRWSLPDTIEPRVKRIFRLGHILENELILLLSRVPGITVHERDPGSGKQFNFSYLGGHFAGSMDGCIHGIPEAPKTWHVLEIKTVAAKRFKDMVNKGVEQWSPEYYAQMQCYMGASGMGRALFVAYNKDNSDLYMERIKIDKLFFPSMIAAAERIITDPFPPVSSYPKRDWYEAKFMSEEAQAVYWGDCLPIPNCRNCRFSRPLMDRNDGQWQCQFHNEILHIRKQLTGCGDHNFLPALVQSDAIECHADCTQYKTPDGLEFWNAKSEDRQPQVFSSNELFHLSKNGLTAEVLGDKNIATLRVQFDGEVVG